MRWTVPAALALAAACGSAPRAPTRTPAQPATSTAAADDQDDEDDGGLICQEERMTGTNVSKMVCRTQAEIDEERNAAMEWEKHPRNGTSGVEP
jgi:hypothetical protein